MNANRGCNIYLRWAEPEVSQEIYLAGLQATVILQLFYVFADGVIHSGIHGSTSHRYNINRQHPVRC